ncbi:hypothetical protein PC116_g14425 [Phytophthora cactorum]|nr:hypothetical protein PC114_g1109 [Phytophthora cactorum]KAG3015788.1 hypothetical protein PC119_g11621 [Phytophthora cactorum]KAG3017665.1 hypothetical protein PC120_g10892 [Phytophthora cactorum]KAG3165074.1 hypothetical protein C6341_g12492 [Phytophthora cactorum]KAG3184474.1 hypothetical protein PC128_g13715 [Phytophthora cactorum]
MKTKPGGQQREGETQSSCFGAASEPLRRNLRPLHPKSQKG